MGPVMIYPTPESLMNKIDEYFETCFHERWNEKKQDYEMQEIKPPTMSGLARYLGFSTRSELINYHSENPLYEKAIDDAKLRIEDYLEQKLVYSKAPAGIMFSLKNNAGWEEKGKLAIGSSDIGMKVIRWDDNAQDVIDVNAVKPLEAPKIPLEKGVGTPPGEGQIESTGDIE